MFIVAAVLYISVVYIGYVNVHSDLPEMWTRIYLALYSLCSAVMLWMLVSILRGFRAQYNSAIGVDYFHRDEKKERAKRYKRKFWIEMIWYFILPRRFDWFFKSFVSLSTFYFACLVLHVSLSDANILIRWIIAYIGVELLSKQNTYIWNEIRGRVEDANSSTKRNRIFAKVLGDPASIGCCYSADRVAAIGIFLFWVRFWISLLFGLIVWMSYNFALPLIFIIVVYIVQFFYEMIGKNIGHMYKICIASIGYLERSTYGLLIAYSFSRKTSVNIWVIVSLFSAWTVIFAFLFLAAYWRAEEIENNDQNIRRRWFIHNYKYFGTNSSAAMFTISSAIASLYLKLSLVQSMIFVAIHSIVGIAYLVIDRRFCLRQKRHKTLALNYFSPDENTSPRRLRNPLLILILLATVAFLVVGNVAYILPFSITCIIDMFYYMIPYRLLLPPNPLKILVKILVDINQFMFNIGKA